MNRKTFLKILATTPLASLMASCTTTKQKKPEYLYWKRINLNIGLGKEVRIVHVSDTHICYADEREDELKRKLAYQRELAFCGRQLGVDGPIMRNLYEAIYYANSVDALLVHTGDLIDFTSKINFELGRKALERCNNYIMSVGNHEFSQYMYLKQVVEDDAYKAESAPDVKKMVGHDIEFASKIFNGINVITVDNNYYRFTENALGKLQAEVAKGLPIIIGFHMPIYTPEFFEYGMGAMGNQCSWLVDVPADKLAMYKNEQKRKEQAPTKATTEFVKYMKSQPLIKAVLCGHFHSAMDATVFGNVRQYCVGATNRYLAQEFIIN